MILRQSEYAGISPTGLVLAGAPAISTRSCSAQLILVFPREINNMYVQGYACRHHQVYHMAKILSPRWKSKAMIRVRKTFRNVSYPCEGLPTTWYWYQVSIQPRRSPIALRVRTRSVQQYDTHFFLPSVCALTSSTALDRYIQQYCLY